jgi:hypothetical protein
MITYEVLHLHDRVQLRNRSAGSPEVRLRHGSPRQKNSSTPTSKTTTFQFFLKLVQPYRHDLTVCCECMFGWYWLAG